jgi:predicted ATPase
MKIVRFRLVNYKSFLDSGEFNLTGGFNVIVGQNNVGKTALLEGLGLGFGSQPHQSLTTKPHPSFSASSVSHAEVTFELTKFEFLALAKVHLPRFYIHFGNNENPEEACERFLNFPKDLLRVRMLYVPGNSSTTVQVEHFPLPGNTQGILTLEYNPESDKLTYRPSRMEHGADLRTSLSSLLLKGIYAFRAERMNIGHFSFGDATLLQPDASNLPQVLHVLQSSNTNRFRRLNDAISQIFPEIRQITVPPLGGSAVQVLLWSIDPNTERPDLAIPLVQSGTGIGQVLAILYVVFTAESPRTIIIDEPQSFLHPGASRKLFSILATFPQHQYIIATHSPTLIPAATSNTVLLVRKRGTESKVEHVSSTDTSGLRTVLAAVGARLSDVFGADAILWVEGRTEEVCFPMILERISKQPLMGVQILGLRSTGDFEGKHSAAAFQLYRKLSGGSALLPPAIAFVFDTEQRTAKQEKDLTREGKGAVVFLKRRMYENYLLNPRAISDLLQQLDSGSDTPVTVESVQDWIKEHGAQHTDRKAPLDYDSPHWLPKVHGANLLKGLFAELTYHRVEFDKVAHGSALTAWLIENDPEALREVADMLSEILRTRSFVMIPT